MWVAHCFLMTWAQLEMDTCTAMSRKRRLCFPEWNIHRPPNDMGLDLRVTKSRQKLRVKWAVTGRAQCLTAPRQSMAKECHEHARSFRKTQLALWERNRTHSRRENTKKSGAGYLAPLFLSRFLKCSAQCLWHEHCCSWKGVKQMLGIVILLSKGHTGGWP